MLKYSVVALKIQLRETQTDEYTSRRDCLERNLNFTFCVTLQVQVSVLTCNIGIQGQTLAASPALISLYCKVTRKYIWPTIASYATYAFFWMP